MVFLLLLLFYFEQMKNFAKDLINKLVLFVWLSSTLVEVWRLLLR